MTDAEKGWDWIVGFYNNPAVKSACLVFQDRYKIDVTFLLFLCWLDHQGRRLDEHYLTIYRDHKSLVKKIKLVRRFRRFVSTFSFARNLKKRLLENELDLEKDLFFGLCQHPTLPAQSPVLAKNYITSKGGVPSAAASVFLKLLNV